MKKLAIVTMLLLFILSITSGCAVPVEETPVDTGIAVTDSLGREVVFETIPEKIISISPGTTEILFALGLDDKIIAVSDYCDYPEAALAKPKIGGFQDPNLEVILSMEPDVVFSAGGIQEELITKMDELGINVVVLDADNIEQILENITIAGQVTGKDQKAQELVADLSNRMNSVIEKVKEEPKPTVFFEVWDDPLMTAGSTSFINNVIETAGGTSIGAVNAEEFYNFSMEQLLEADPDIYIVNTHSHEPQDIKVRNGYDVLSAVKNDKVFAIDDNTISRPGPRIIDGLEAMAKILHPDLFN